MKRPELSRKEIKILEYRLKTHLSARPSSRKPKKGVQNAPEHESAIGTQEHHSALLVPNFTLLGFGPILFRYRKGTPFSTFSQKDASQLAFYLSLLFFFSILVSINRDWISKFSTFFYAQRETPIHTLKFLTAPF